MYGVVTVAQGVAACVVEGVRVVVVVAVSADVDGADGVVDSHQTLPVLPLALCTPCIVRPSSMHVMHNPGLGIDAAYT